MYSLTRRLLVYVTLALAVFLGLSGIALDALFRDVTERSLHQLLDAQIVALIASAESAEDGSLVGASRTAEARLQTPGSGLYAQVRDASGKVLWRSPSAAGAFIDFGPPARSGKSSFVERRRRNGERLAIAARAIQWDVDSGAGQQLTFAVAASMAPYDRQLARFRVQLGVGLVVLSSVLLLTLALLLRRLTSPLRRLEAEISAVESGAREALGGGYPREVAGVAHNLNALLVSERARIARYRDTLGNLAHSLKTPLSVLRNALDTRAAPDVQVMAGSLERMDQIIEHQLRRAVAAGGRVLGQAPVPVLALAQDLRRTMLRVHASKDLSIVVDVPAHACFAGDAADLVEALGNLADNACKWCTSQVRIEGRIVEGGARPRLLLAVDDDGPGYPAELRSAGPARGQRADETQPGHGIGLAMVQEMAELYGGTMTLGVAPLGGARVELVLPGAVAAPA